MTSLAQRPRSTRSGHHRPILDTASLPLIDALPQTAGDLGQVYIASIAALPRLRSLAGMKTFTPPLGIVALVALSLCFWATFQSSREQWGLIAAFLGAGTILFVVARYSRTAAPVGAT